YDFARNPLVHALGLGLEKTAWQVVFGRALHAPHPDSGWTDQELSDLESGRCMLSGQSIVIAGKQWTMFCDCFYFDVIKLLHRLTSNLTQMQAAERRFQQG